MPRAADCDGDGGSEGHCQEVAEVSPDPGDGLF